MQEQLTVAFTEDVVGLTEIERMIAETPEDDRYEISLASDRPGLAMRRWIYRTAMEEGEGAG
jgi:vanillate O-demethylase monooxygenase subunit